MLFNKTTLNQKSGEMIDVFRLKHLKFAKKDKDHVVTSIDSTGYEIVRDYGASIIDAINDLHHSII